MKRDAAMRRALLLAALAGCARMGAPPGGPPDFRPPALVATDPESLAVRPDFTGWASFTFDEVVSEGGTPNFGTGRGALEQLTIVSPDSGVPRVRWRRNRLEVQPRTGWRPNTVYRLEFAPGLSDLSRNTRKESTVLTFTTGAPAPTRYLTGRAVDWVGRRFIPNALIVATYSTDSAVYRTLSDSTGRFRFGPLPDGDVLVSASMEEGQPDRRLAPTREAWDTVRVVAGFDSVGEVWAFARDTLPPRIAQGGATRVDSFTIAINFSQPLDPTLRLDSTSIGIRVLPDSTPLMILSGLPEVIHDSIYQPIDSARRAQFQARTAAERTDSLKRLRADSIGITVAQLDSIAADSLAKNPPAAAEPRPGRDAAAPSEVSADTTARDEPLEPRPIISPRMLIRVNGIVQLGTRYLIELRGVRAMGGLTADTIRTQLVTPDPPKPAPKDSATVPPPDSAKATSGDSTTSGTTQRDSAAQPTGMSPTAARETPPPTLATIPTPRVERVAHPARRR